MATFDFVGEPRAQCVHCTRPKIGKKLWAIDFFYPTAAATRTSPSLRQ